MTAREQIEQLRDAISKQGIAFADAERQLQSILGGLEGPYCREKIGSAIGWARICQRPRELERYGGMERVRLFLLHDLMSAARNAP
jgi:hypothetical protein